MTCESFPFPLKNETLTFSTGSLSSENRNIRCALTYCTLRDWCGNVWLVRFNLLNPAFITFGLYNLEIFNTPLYSCLLGGLAFEWLQSWK